MAPQRSRNYVITQNNYQDTTLLDNVECRYVCYSKEVGDSGTPHLQSFICFENGKSIAAVIKLLPGCHVERMNGSIQENVDYVSGMCEKKGFIYNETFTERGDRPISNDDKGRAEQLRWQRTLELAKAGKIEEIDASMQIRYDATLYRIAARNAPKPANLEDVCGVWIYGAPGAGKTRYVEQNYPGAFDKSHDKDWLNYDGEQNVVLEDLHVDCLKGAMVTHLKHWADYKPFRAFVKFSTGRFRPKNLIVTSNFTIDDADIREIDKEALKRRFKKKIHMINFNELRWNEV